MEKLSGNYRENVAEMNRVMRVDENFDIIKRAMNVNGHDFTLYYIDGFIAGGMMQKLLLYFVTLKEFGDGSETAAETFASRYVPTVEVDVSDAFHTLQTMLLAGCAVMFADGFGANAIIMDMRTYPGREPSEPENDKVMRGPRDGFVETLVFNTALVRRRIRDPDLTVRYLSVGKRSRTDLAIVYLANKADAKLVAEITGRIEKIDTDALPMGHQSLAECLIRRKWYNPFPKIRKTERPDAACASVLEGSILLICDTTPEVFILPTAILDFLQESDDFYFPPLTGTYLRVVRHIVFWASVIVTPLWYLLLMNEAYLPPWLAFVIPDTAGEIPVLAQLLLTEFALDGLKLASLNTPSTLSNSLSVVGGLLLGDFAITIGWLTPEVIFYMSFVAIANFTQSSYELGYAFKYLRILTLILTALFNVYGFLSGIAVMLILVACNATVNGKHSYLYPLVPFDGRALRSLLFRVRKGKNEKND